LFSLDRIELKRLDVTGGRRNRLVVSLGSRPERLLAGVLLGNTLVNVASSSVAVALVARADTLLNRDTLVAVAVLADTLLLLILGEILPKGMAVQWPAATARFYAPVLYPILRLLRPAAQILEGVALGFLRMAGIRAPGGMTGLGRRELQLLFEDVQGKGGFSEGEHTIAENVFDFFETRAWEIMTPRVDVWGIPVDASRREQHRLVLESRHTRMPVYRGSIDQIVGFINAKEFLLDPDLPMEDLLKPVHFVPERARVAGVLAEVQARKLTLVVVVNEYGGTSGIITNEDIIEEVVGEIFSEQERDQEPEVERLGDTTWRVDGLVTLTELAEAMEREIEPGPAPTVAGHIAHRLGRPPRAHETVREGDVVFRVLQVARHRARRVEVTVVPEKAPEP
jgi:CBS domain containing-hemolysin-like protein